MELLLLYFVFPSATPIRDVQERPFLHFEKSDQHNNAREYNEIWYMLSSYS